MTRFARERVIRIARRVALSLFLGIAVTLALCLAFAHWSVAMRRTAWENIAQRGDSAVHVVHDSSFGKSVVGWAPLDDEVLATLDNDRHFDNAAVRRGDRVPPAWSSYWNDAEFAAARARTRAGSANLRLDLAVGWPCRAFVGTYLWDPAASPPREAWRSARHLPTLILGDSGGIVRTEYRAIPLRVHWPGLIATVAFWSALLFIAFAIAARGAPPVDPSAMRARSLRPRITRSTILASLALGLALTLVTGVVLPMCLRPWSATHWSTERPYTASSRSLFWSERFTRYNPDAIANLTPASARALDHELGRLRTTSEWRLRMPGPRDEFDAGGPHSFESTRTGWPFPILWGARWHISDLNPRGESVNLEEFKTLRDAAPVFARGLKLMPTRPLYLGWIANTAIYALACFALLVCVDLLRQSRRRRRSLCPRCAYNLSATPADAPCPECGTPPR